MVLLNDPIQKITLVPNSFIDEAMAKANGEYVKVYLLLLRLGGKELPPAQMADRLNMLESDVLRALRYWTEEGFIAAEAAEKPAAPADAASRESVKEKPAEKAAAKPERRRSYLPSEIEALKNAEDFQDMLFNTEHCMGKPLSFKETEILAYYYEDCGMECQALEYAVEYCIGLGKESFSYIETVIRNWHASGVRTLEQAKEAVRRYTDFLGLQKRVAKAYGIHGGLGTEQEKTVQSWLTELEMTPELIEKACGLTMVRIGEANMKHTEGILRDWKAKGIRTPEDIPLKDGKTQKRSDQKHFRSERTGTDYSDAIW